MYREIRSENVRDCLYRCSNTTVTLHRTYIIRRPHNHARLPFQRRQSGKRISTTSPKISLISKYPAKSLHQRLSADNTKYTTSINPRLNMPDIQFALGRSFTVANRRTNPRSSSKSESAHLEITSMQPHYPDPLAHAQYDQCLQASQPTSPR